MEESLQELGKMTVLLIRSTLACVISLIVAAAVCYIWKDYSNIYYDLLTASSEMLVAARSCLGVGVFGVLLLQTAEKAALRSKN